MSSGAPYTAAALSLPEQRLCAAGRVLAGHATGPEREDGGARHGRVRGGGGDHHARLRRALRPSGKPSHAADRSAGGTGRRSRHAVHERPPGRVGLPANKPLRCDGHHLPDGVHVGRGEVLPR